MLPAVVLIAIGLNAYHALIISQVVLSVQLPFTIVPLLVLARSPRVMGEMRAGGKTMLVGWTVAAIIIALNVFLLYQTFAGGGG